MSITSLSAIDLKSKLDLGELTSTQVCQAFLDRTDSCDDRVGAYLSVDREQVLSDAAAIDRRRADGQRLGLLSGLPVAVKDLLCTRGQVTSCGSRMLASFVPPYDATVISRLRAADGVVLGKTNLDEFAMGGSTETSALGTTRNPWDLERVPGGSSGGSAAAVAARLAPLALGTDTGGSIRQPAAFCGVTGLKPTYGRVSRFGLVAFASSLDQIGPMANSIEGCALLLEAIAGHDPRDATSAQVAMPAISQSINEPLAGLRLGVIRDHFTEGLEPQVATTVRDAIEVFRSLGAEVIDVSMPHSAYGIATYYILAPSEASSNLARYDGAHYGYRCDVASMTEELAAEYASAEDEITRDRIDSHLVRMYRDSRSQAFGDEVKRRIMLGTYALSAGYYDAYYLKAQKVRRLIRDDYDAAFRQVDFVMGPVTPTPAFRRGEHASNPLAMYLGDLYTVTANLAGMPALSLPCGFTTEGLPIGLQLQGQPFDESRLLRAGRMYQHVTDWHTRHPRL